MATIYMLRHSETEYSRLRKICGVSNPPLSDEGFELARARAHVVNGRSFAAILTSPSQRCIQTLDTMMSGSVYSIDARLREIDFGALEGKPINEVFRACKDAPDAYEDDWKTYHFPGGDNMVTYFEQAGETVLELAERPEDAILLISHNGFINSVLANLVFRDIDKLFTVSCPTCGMVELKKGNGSFAYRIY